MSFFSQFGSSGTNSFFRRSLAPISDLSTISSKKSLPWYRKPIVWLGTLGTLFAGDTLITAIRHSLQNGPKPSLFRFWRSTHESRIESIMNQILKLVPKSKFREMENKHCYHGAVAVELTQDFQTQLGHPVEEVFFDSGKNPSNKLRGWHVRAKNQKPTILFSMGSGGCSLEMIQDYKALLDEGYGFMAYEYRGYGKSQGKTDEPGLYEDLHAASAHLKDSESIPVNQQIFYGISLGGPVSAQVAKDLTAANRPPKALILGSTMTRFEDVVKQTAEKQLPVPTWLLPVHRRMPSKLDTESKLVSVTCPTLLLHSKKDTTMPYEFAERLVKKSGAAEDKKQLVEVQGDHMQSLACPEAIQAIQQFLPKLEPAS